MTDELVQVLADQVDALADKVNRLEQQMATLVDALSRDHAAAQLDLTPVDLGRLKFPLEAVFACSQHRMDRERRAASAAREAAITQLIKPQKT